MLTSIRLILCVPTTRTRTLHLFLFTLVAKLEDKLDQYKFGLPTLLIKGEREIYRGTKDEIDKVNKPKAS